MKHTFDGMKLNKPEFLLSMSIGLFIAVWFMFFGLSLPLLLNGNSVYEICNNYLSNVNLYLSSFSSTINIKVSICASYIVNYSTHGLFIVPITILLSFIFNKNKGLFAGICAFSIFMLLELLKILVGFGSFDLSNGIMYFVGSVTGVIIYNILRRKYSDQNLNRVVKFFNISSIPVMLFAITMIYFQLVQIA